MTYALQTQGLSKRLGQGPRGFCLAPIDLTVPAGTITGLVGANGAGKSTLLKLILGLLKPDAGQVLLFGQELAESGQALRRRIGFVQESPTLPEHLRLADLGRMTAPFYPTWDPAEFQRLGQAFAIPARTPFAKLSQGNRMKAALCLAMAHRPELLILDEPTSGLDPLARREFLDLLLEVVQDEGRAVLFSTHITSDLDRIADHLAILNQGRLSLAGAKDDLMEAWILVKGGEELLATDLGRSHCGGQRSACGLELLCPAQAGPVPTDAVVERPRIEDLVYLFDRPLDVLQETEAVC